MYGGGHTLPHEIETLVERVRRADTSVAGRERMRSIFSDYRYISPVADVLAGKRTFEGQYAEIVSEGVTRARQNPNHGYEYGFWPTRVAAIEACVGRKENQNGSLTDAIWQYGIVTDPGYEKRATRYFGGGVMGFLAGLVLLVCAKRSVDRARPQQA